VIDYDEDYLYGLDLLQLFLLYLFCRIGSRTVNYLYNKFGAVRYLSQTLLIRN
jgi:hypothetical protein